MTKLKSSTISGYAIAVTLAASVAAFAVCPDPLWGPPQQTCQSCQRQPACIDECGNPPTFGSPVFCGSYDYVQGCRETYKKQMWCQNCVGDPVTTGWWYTDTCYEAYACTQQQKPCF